MKEGIILELKENNAVLITKEGEFLSIPSKPSWSIGQEIRFNQKIIDEHSTNNNYRRNILMKKGVWIALAACLMLLLIPLATITEASTYVTIDINPSIELELKGDKVINVKALNSDAEKIIFNIPKDYEDIYSITTYIIDKSKELGYLTPDEENYIMIGVCDNDTSFSKTEFENFIEDKLTEQQLEADILFVNGTAEDKKLADNKSVSLGKYVLQQNKKLEGIDISDEDLLKDDIKNILDTEKENKNSNNNSDNGNKDNANIPNNNSDNSNNGNINVPNNNNDNSNDGNANIPNNNGDNGNKNNTNVPNNNSDNSDKNNVNIHSNNGDKDNVNIPNNNSDNSNKDNANIPKSDKSNEKKIKQ